MASYGNSTTSIRSLADIEALERQPYDQTLPERTTKPI